MNVPINPCNANIVKNSLKEIPSTTMNKVANIKNRNVNAVIK
jgi:hypothetical protein